MHVQVCVHYANGILERENALTKIMKLRLLITVVILCGLRIIVITQFHKQDF